MLTEPANTLAAPSGQVDRRDELDAAVREILDQAGDAVREIEISIWQIGDLMLELSRLEDLPEEVERLADDLSCEAQAVADGLSERLERLRREISADNAADGLDIPT
jgi:chaperonin cofactor prefoldin